jgi:heme exporter protein A
VSLLLRFDGVSLRRGGRMLLENFDLALAKGEGVHLGGPNGVGKSSLIRLAAGLLHAELGRVERSPLALADEHLALDRELPLARAMAFWSPSGAAAAMTALGLAALAAVPVRLLSTGQAKRAALARVAASGAPVWLLDEPLNGLDEDGIARLDALIEAHRQAGGAVLAASHRPLGGHWRQVRLGE